MPSIAACRISSTGFARCPTRRAPSGWTGWEFPTKAGAREYRASLALHLASRTDPELRPIFLDRASRYDRVWREEIAKVFPEWREHSMLDAMNDFVWIAVEGLALNADIWADQTRVDTMLAFIAHAAHEVHAGRLALA